MMKQIDFRRYSEIYRLYSEGRTYKEIAETVGCSIGTVANALKYYKRARRPARKPFLKLGKDYIQLRLKRKEKR